MTASTTSNPSPRLPAIARAAMQLQVFLLRRNMMGALGNEIMVITTTGRKSGRQVSTPIGFLPDGDSIIALNTNGWSNWYKNALANPHVELNIRGQARKFRMVPVTDESERRRIFDLFRRDRRQNFSRMFGVPVDATAELLEQAYQTRRFVRFFPE